MTKLNIGCECNVLSGWENLDNRKMHPDVKEMDVRKGLPYASGTVVEIYGGNFLDHLTYFEAVAFLRECWRVLCNKGKAQFSVMNTDKIINQYLLGHMDRFDHLQPCFFKELDPATKFATFLLGNLAQEKEYTGHKMLYTAHSLITLGEQVGFTKGGLVKPDFSQEPWCVENPEYADHNLYVSYVKG